MVPIFYLLQLASNGEDTESNGVAIDINQVNDSSLPPEGTLIFTGEDGTQSNFLKFYIELDSDRSE